MPRDYLVGDRQMVLEGVDFREKQIPSKKEQSQIAARALHVIERYLTVEEIFGLLEKRGLKVVVIDAAENIDGLAASVRRPGKCPVRIILVRKGLHGEGQRFSVAHEPGHIVHKFGGDEKHRETAAHRFACAFLLPAEVLWSKVDKHRSSIGWSGLFALKHLFGQCISLRGHWHSLCCPVAGAVWGVLTADGGGAILDQRMRTRPTRRASREHRS